VINSMSFPSAASAAKFQTKIRMARWFWID
jgi:hypothetical protein